MNGDGLTSWNDNWSSWFPGHPSIGGLKGVTDFVVVSRHDPIERRDVWHVGLACGSEVARLIGIERHSACAVMNDFGDLVRVPRHEPEERDE